MVNDELIKNKAYDRVSFVMSGEIDSSVGMVSILFGNGSFKLEVSPNSGHNYYYIIEAIYEYYLKNPNSGVDKCFYKTLNDLLGRINKIGRLSLLLSIILFQLKNQNENISPFNIDIVSILKNFRDRLKYEKELFDNVDLMNKMTEYNEELNKYDIKIL